MPEVLPFDGAISKYAENDAPKDIRNAIDEAKKSDILDESYPYKAELSRKIYEDQLYDLQIELVKMQAWAKRTGQRIAIVFEGRDAAGKGGTIKRFRMNLNPRGARVVALPKPTDREATNGISKDTLSTFRPQGKSFSMIDHGTIARSLNTYLASAPTNNVNTFSRRSRILRAC